MKKEFPEFYKLTDKQLATLGESAVIAFDASFLLDLYRYSPGVAKNMFSVLDGLGKQVWLTHQAAYEFHNNRLNVIAGLRSKHAEVIDYLEAEGNKLIEKIENSCKKHPLLDSKQIVDPIRQSIEKAREHLGTIAYKHAKPTLAVDEDAIWGRIAKVFAGRIGPEFTDEELRAIEQEGKKRFEKKTPPGFEDSKKDYPYGDLILWKQLLEYCKIKGLPAFFVTSDVKQDWWLASQGSKLGARPELRKEFLKHTGQEFHLYETTHFVEIYAPKFQVAPEEPIKEIRKIRAERTNDKGIGRQLMDSAGLVANLEFDPAWREQQMAREVFLRDLNPIYVPDREARDRLSQMLHEQMHPHSDVVSAYELVRRHLGTEDFGLRLPPQGAPKKKSPG